MCTLLLLLLLKTKLSGICFSVNVTNCYCCYCKLHTACKLVWNSSLQRLQSKTFLNIRDTMRTDAKLERGKVTKQNRQLTPIISDHISHWLHHFLIWLSDISAQQLFVLVYSFTNISCVYVMCCQFVITRETTCVSYHIIHHIIWYIISYPTSYRITYLISYTSYHILSSILQCSVLMKFITVDNALHASAVRSSSSVYSILWP